MKPTVVIDARWLVCTKYFIMKQFILARMMKLPEIMSRYAYSRLYLVRVDYCSWLTHLDAASSCRMGAWWLNLLVRLSAWNDYSARMQ